ncbi:DUF4136 domain-containing protein [Halorubrum tibetense]|uniref:DUF4136 domain-containing protein n=2 Tax=cellular organisms TaxID=131567 RepID=A0ABD5SDW2_9EURY
MSIALFGAALLVGCSGIKVMETQSASKSLLTAKTYAWQSQPVTSSALMKRFDASVRQAVDEQLQQRGYQLVDNVQADFLVDYRFTEIQASTASVGDEVDYGGWQRDNDGMNFVGWSADPAMSEYPVGVLNLALLNPKDNAELWEVYGSKMLDETRNIDHIEANVKRVVKRLFAGFKRKAN